MVGTLYRVRSCYSSSKLHDVIQFGDVYKRDAPGNWRQVVGSGFLEEPYPTCKGNWYKIVAIDNHDTSHGTFDLLEIEDQQIKATPPDKATQTNQFRSEVKYDSPLSSGIGQFSVGTIFKLGAKDPLQIGRIRVLNGKAKFATCGTTITIPYEPIVENSGISYQITKIDGNFWEFTSDVVLEVRPRATSGTILHYDAHVTGSGYGAQVPVGTRILIRPDSEPSGNAWISTSQQIGRLVSGFPYVGVRYMITEVTSNDWTLVEVIDQIGEMKPETLKTECFEEEVKKEVKPDYTGVTYEKSPSGSWNKFKVGDVVTFDDIRSNIAFLAPGTAVGLYLQSNKPIPSIGRQYRIASQSDTLVKLVDEGTIPTPIQEADSYKVDHFNNYPTGSSNNNTTKQEQNNMNGKVYTGHVVRTYMVQQAEGVATGVMKSEIVYTTSKPIIAPTEQSAKNIILALAARQDGKLDLESVTSTLEVVVVTAS